MHEQTEFDLPGGRSIQLVALDQSFTEEGRLEGLPTRESNRRRLEWLGKQLPRKWPRIAHHLLPTVETLIPWDDVKPYPFGTPATSAYPLHRPIPVAEAGARSRG